ncbi:MAG: hypothetical protein EP310_09695 [Bacteroidetes bacterium]|nr:MAG: hypothetical protein EP310_09695 [Bacteroidota bacterium]
MRDEKNTDDIIREKLENFQATPPPHIWNNVQLQLAAHRRRNRMVYMGWISAAALVVLAFLAGWYFNDNLKEDKSKIVNSEITQPVTSENEPTIQSEEFIVENQSSAESNTENSNQISYTETNQLAGVSPVNSKITLSKTPESGINATSREIFNLIKLSALNVQFTQNQKIHSELARQNEVISAKNLSEKEALLVAENIKNVKEASKSDNNWKMGMYVAPSYSSYSSSYSDTYAKNMNYTGSDGDANVGGGFSVQYKTRKRWIVESGIYYAQNGQQSGNLSNVFARNENADYALADPGLYFSNEVRVVNNTMAMNSAAGVIQFSETPKGAELTGDFEAKNTGVANLIVPNGEFSQVFEFMEIPLYVRYRVVDRKIGVELLTGFNTGIVVGNNAYIENQYGVQNIGETADISTFNISGTLGMGVNYALGKHFSVAVEPRFSYYLNSINSNPSVEFRPYRMGFYTGVTYEF